MVTLTVFTPTYNREKLLLRGYQALCRQTSHDFCWLIVDDGSVDNTMQIVESWIDESSKLQIEGGFVGFSKDAPWLNIRYCYKENGGLHTGYNKAIELMNSEICVCIDSDDYMPDDAVEIIINFWNKHKHRDIAGFIGLDYQIGGGPIGGEIEEVDEPIHIFEIKSRLRHYGDTKMVIRVDLFKQVAPQPSFPGEKNFNPIYLVLLIDRKYSFLTINKNLCFVDYQDSGMTFNIYRQYINSPNSFAALRVVALKQPKITARRFLLEVIHYVSSKILAKKSREIFNDDVPVVLALLLFIPGWMLSIYIKWRAKS